MVKNVFIILLFATLFMSCNYTLIPRSYFKNYKTISSYKLDTFPLIINNVYVFENIVILNEYKKHYNYNGKVITYEFFYKNNLAATTTIRKLTKK